jgi:hypothetical protein
MPGLDQREKEADGEKRPPIGEKDAGLLEFESTRQQCSGQHQKSHLNTPKDQV